MNTTRAFIAIALNEQLHKELACLQAKLKSSEADVKWVEPRNIHLTLKFLGNITDEQIGQVKNAIEKTASKFSVYSIHLAQIGAFPKIEYPRVIWVGMDEGRKETTEIYKALKQELSEIGFPEEERTFSPHLTLGRVRSLKNKQQLAKIMEQEKNFNSTGRVLVTEIILFKSTLKRTGSVYDPIFKGSLIKT
ncbi:MAG: RNA 2',3'-cyclic phosphodiesterase [Candidatus Omnitrophica bacterium]|nr:RNA 2',3'-cyclic phosphodiesterase [Candidatus Omnitrophota bacterium]